MTPDWATEALDGFHLCHSSVVSNSHCGGSCGCVLFSQRLLTRCLGKAFVNQLRDTVLSVSFEYSNDPLSVLPGHQLLQNLGGFLGRGHIAGIRESVCESASFQPYGAPSLPAPCWGSQQALCGPVAFLERYVALEGRMIGQAASCQLPCTVAGGLL